MSPQQFGFMAALDPDIILIIFSFLSQKDCLACMAVCRDWYHTVPQYAQDTWKTLRLGEHDPSNKNQRQIRCLGRHVKNVVLDAFNDDQELYYTMHKLADWGCTEIESLEFNQCQTDDQNAFFEALAKLARHLTQLKMMEHGSNIALLHVLNTCPELTHLIYQVEPSICNLRSIYDTEPIVGQAKESPPLEQASKITHLCLDAVMDNEIRLYPILKRCPDLRCFIGPTTNVIDDDLEQDDQPYIQFWNTLDQLFDFCPKLIFVQPHLSHHSISDVQKVFDTYTSGMACSGLRYLELQEGFGAGRITRYLTKNQATLEHLALKDYGDSRLGTKWSTVFEPLQLTQLRTVICCRIYLDTASFVTLLNNCPVLEVLSVDFQFEVKLDNIQLLRTLHRLRSLEINAWALTDRWLMIVFERCPALENIDMVIPYPHITSQTYLPCTNQLKRFTLVSSDWRYGEDITDTDEAVSNFIRFFTAHSKLETIRITPTIGIGAKALLTVADVPTLKVCDIGIDSLYCREAVQSDFARLLLGSAIEVLGVYSDGALSTGFFKALGKLPLLKWLYVSPLTEPEVITTTVDRFDLLTLLRTSCNLMGVYFSKVNVEGFDAAFEFDKLLILVEQEAPAFQVHKNDSRHPQPPEVPDTWNSDSYEIAIKRISCV